MRLDFKDLHITRVSPDGLSFFSFIEDGTEMSGYTDVSDAGSKRSFCAVIFQGNVKQGCTVFITRSTSLQSGKAGLMI